MKRFMTWGCLLAGLLVAPIMIQETRAAGPADDAVGKLLDGIEQRYSGSGVTARFFQISTIKAMDVTDTADGKVFIKRPGRMKWEYEKPERQVILTDGNTLWIYRPADNQVMTGKAPTYFGEGKGVGFLSDIHLIREKFEVTPLPAPDGADPGLTWLKLIPKEPKPDLAEVRLGVSTETKAIARVATYNAYGDETRIELHNQAFDQNIDESVFRFEIPPGADIVKMEE